MAFFMLMWLLNATTEKQRKGLADYFSPTIPVNRISGGGDGAFGGDSTLAEMVLPQNGTGGLVAVPLPKGTPSTPGQDTSDSKDENDFAKIEEALLGVQNGLAVEGHVRTEPIVVAKNRTWDVSTRHAHRARVLAEDLGFDAQRVTRVVGHSDREPVADNPLSVRNNRLEFILLR